MAERGKAQSITLSAGSNQRIKAGSGTLYGLYGWVANGSSVKAENSLNLGATPDLNSVTSNTTLVFYGPTSAAGTLALTFTPGIGFDAGLVVAGTSNARISVIYE